jgi:hypothetical protein
MAAATASPTQRASGSLSPCRPRARSRRTPPPPSRALGRACAAPRPGQERFHREGRRVCAAETDQRDRDSIGAGDGAAGTQSCSALVSRHPQAVRYLTLTKQHQAFALRSAGHICDPGQYPTERFVEFDAAQFGECFGRNRGLCVDHEGVSFERARHGRHQNRGPGMRPLQGIEERKPMNRAAS